MADVRRSGEDDALPSIPQAEPERPNSFSVDDTKPSQSETESAGVDNGSDGGKSGEAPEVVTTENVTQPRTSTIEQPRPAVDPMVAKQVNEVMVSEVGIPTLLNRLKQSIASAKEFALFLKKRSVIEDDHAQGLRKLARSAQENARRPEHRQGTFSHSYDEMVFIHDRMAENGSQFAASLHQMHEDLLELVGNAERGRKMWKANGLAAEQKVADLDAVMRKSKTKYDSLAEEYDRARTGEARQGGGKVLGAFKAHKSAAQQEEDLFRKAQTADQTYQGHVQALQGEKTHLEKSSRPEAVRAMQELIGETDSGVALQMQKFAAFNEKLLLGNGMIISPFNSHGGESAGQPRSLRQAVAAIDNEKDLNDFVLAHHSKIQPYAEVKYERNPLLAPQSSSVSQQPPAHGIHVPQAVGQTSGPGDSLPNRQSFTMGSRSSTGNFGPIGNTMTSQGPPGGPPVAGQGPPPVGMPDPSWAPAPYTPTHGRSASHGNMLDQQPGMQQHQFAPRTSIQTPSRNNGDTGAPPQLGALPFQSSQPPTLSSTLPGAAPFPPSGPGGPGAGPGGPPGYPAHGHGIPGGPSKPMPAPSKPVFGVSLNRLYERDGLAVPMVVYQCIQAVDLFGLGVEGIYRQSGSMTHIHRLKGMFDAESQNPALDFRNPENFYHDVNGVTGLLKQFFRDLPDPILTMEHHDAFVNAAKHEDDIVRRDSLHAIINALPDPNYATLRAMTLHLHRVMDNSHVNRMNSHNLAVIFGPTLMGSDPSTAITDAGWQIKVIHTILQNTYQIFDED